jgi:uncharacterized protein YraI
MFRTWEDLMFRKSLALLATGLILFAALLVQMSIAQAAAPGQITPDAADEEPQPLPQPLRIRINQAIPLTLSVPASLLAAGTSVTGPLTVTTALTDTAALEESEAATGTAAAGRTLTGTTTTTGTALLDAAAAAASELITEATDVLENTDVLTDTAADTAADAVGAVDETADNVLTPSEAITGTGVLTVAMPMVGVPVTLELSLDLVVTNTLTSTVPASVTIQLADRTTRTLPLSVTVAALPDGEVVVELLPPVEEETPEVEATEVITEEVPAVEADATAALTPTATTTPTTEVTATVPAPSGLPVVNTTATTTANLRAGPATTFDLLSQVGPGATLAVVGISEDGQWYLLDGGAWIATFLTADTAIANLPLATQELIDQATGVAPAPVATAAATITVTATEVVTPVAAATPVPPAATTAVTPTTTTDANLRAGPGTEFPIIGGTIVGQAINIVGRNADSTWFRLDNTGWIFGELVANPPAPETVPVVNADGTVVEPATAPTTEPVPAEGGGLPLPTPTPAAGATGATETTAAVTGANAAYIGDVQAIIARYDGVAQTMDALLAEATANNAVLTTPAWADRVNAAVGLLRTTGASVGELQAPAALAGAQDSLVAAAQQYTAAGTALVQAVTTGDVAQLETADAAITRANTSLTAVEAALAGAR